jgi:hypothetical protein
MIMKKELLVFTSALCSSFLMGQSLTINELGRYTDGRDGACEISSYDSQTSRLFTTNSVSDSIDIIDVSIASSPSRVGGINVKSYGGGVNSVVVVNGTHLAAAIEADVRQDNGKIVFFNLNGAFVSEVIVGALPDMVAVSPDGLKVICANEGEPNDEYTVDPDGSVSIIDITGGIANLTNSNVTTLGFANAPATIEGSIKKPGTTWKEDLEPEYVAVSEDSKKAYVICQEANVLITLDIENNSIVDYMGLGFKDHSLANNMLDVSNKDDSINIQNWNVKGVYQPDAIATYTVNGLDYVVTANEGDGRDYDGYSSETRIKDLTLDTVVFPDYATLQADSLLGRLKTFTADVIGDTDNDGDVDELYCYGARSFSIWDSNGLVWDSGDDFEVYMSQNHPDFFNTDGGLSEEKDSRSDDKGVEPEAVVIGQIGNDLYAFIGLERQGGVMVYNVSNPISPSFVTYFHTMNTDTMMTDIAPEGLIFIPASESHTSKNLLVVSNEVSGTITIYEVNQNSTVSVESKSCDLMVENIYPNPTKNIINLEFVNDSQKEYVLYDAVGEIVVNGFFRTTQASLDISSKAKGIYFLSLKDVNTKEILTKRIIKN